MNVRPRLPSALRKRAAQTSFCGAAIPMRSASILARFPFWQEPDPALFPICGATATWRKCDALSHRDFLGAFLAAGIGRETLGDFLLEEGRCVFYCRCEVRDFLFAQVAKIGRVGVKLSPSVEEPLPALHHFQPIEAVIASPRLDCVRRRVHGFKPRQGRRSHRRRLRPGGPQPHACARIYCFGGRAPFHPRKGPLLHRQRQCPDQKGQTKACRAQIYLNYGRVKYAFIK